MVPSVIQLAKCCGSSNRQRSPGAELADVWGEDFLNLCGLDYSDDARAIGECQRLPSQRDKRRT